MMASSASKQRKNFLLIACFILVADVIIAQVAKSFWKQWDVRNLERSYRVPSEIYHHDLAPKADSLGAWGESYYPVHTNSLGFKDNSTRDISLASDRHRILFIGDSFTEGIGLPFDQTFVGIVAEQLSNSDTEVLNAGVAGYSPVIYYRKIKYLLESIQLDVDEVVVFLDISDIPDEAYLYRLDENDRVVQRPGFPEWGGGWTGGTVIAGDDHIDRIKRFLKTNSVVFRLLDEIKDRLLFSGELQSRPPNLLGGTRGEWTQAEYLDEFGRPGLEIARQNMERLLEVLNQHSIHLTVVIYPWPAQIHYGDLNSAQVSYWEEWSSDNNSTLINLFPPFFENSDRESVIRDYYFPGDVHFNAAGNRLIGDRFLQEFKAANRHSQ